MVGVGKTDIRLAMNEKELMQHELQCRQTIINNLQDERDRIMEMVNRANQACHRLRDEVVHTTAQIHAIVKATMLLNNIMTLHLPAKLLVKAIGHVLAREKPEDGVEEDGLKFTMREHTPEEAEREKTMRAKIEQATARIKPSS